MEVRAQTNDFQKENDRPMFPPPRRIAWVLAALRLGRPALGSNLVPPRSEVSSSLKPGNAGDDRADRSLAGQGFQRH